MTSLLPTQNLQKKFSENTLAIEAWFEQQWKKISPPIYCSVDLRNANFKLAPIDTNLFPAGFNNLNPMTMPLCGQAAKQIIQRFCSRAKRLLLVPENHTRNLFYLESVAALQNIFIQAGFSVRIGSLNDDVIDPQIITLPSNNTITLEAMHRCNDRIVIKGFDPDLIILNNDLSSGIPPQLHNIAQPIYPPLHSGWASRLKSIHFQTYQIVAAEFAEIIALDPWLIAPLFRNCHEIDFMKREGEDCVIKNTDLLLHAIQAKYNAYNIQQKPFVVVKADAGTYGMAVMMVHSTDELRQLNRKQRTRMSTSKGGSSVSKVIVQEGVYSFETVNTEKTVAEPVIYMIGQQVVGGFYRAHTERNSHENLNAPGMHFEPFPTENTKTTDQLFYAYSVVARLALLSAAQEMSLPTVGTAL